MLYRITIIIFCFFIPSFLSAQISTEDVKEYSKKISSDHGLAEEWVWEILQNATYQESIIEKMERPAESIDWYRYRKIFIKEDRIAAGIDFWIENNTVLEEVSSKYGIPVEILIGILGVETKFGENRGSYKVLDALFTLAFGYPKRSNYFKHELKEFLLLVNEENLDPYNIYGSYAGAIGYCQFMPSSYRAYAKSNDDNGSRDLYNSKEDAIESIANYLSVHRWIKDEKIAIPANKIKKEVDFESKSNKPNNNFKYYENLGFSAVGEVNSDEKVALLDFQNENNKEYWFGYFNFYVITRYNHSKMYALAVFQLGNEVKSRMIN